MRRDGRDLHLARRRADDPLRARDDRDRGRGARRRLHAADDPPRRGRRARGGRRGAARTPRPPRPRRRDRRGTARRRPRRAARRPRRRARDRRDEGARRGGGAAGARGRDPDDAERGRDEQGPPPRRRRRSEDAERPARDRHQRPRSLRLAARARARGERRQLARPRRRGGGDGQRVAGPRARGARGGAADRGGLRRRRRRARPRGARARRAALRLHDRPGRPRAAPRALPDARPARRRGPRPGERGDAAAHDPRARPPQPGHHRRHGDRPRPRPPCRRRAPARHRRRRVEARGLRAGGGRAPAAEAHAAARRRPRDPRPLPGRLVSLDLVTQLMATAEGRCTYAEARFVEHREEALSVRAGEMDDFASSESDGIGVRVRVGGGWGFAATRDISAAGAEAALARALAIAEAQPAGPATPLAAVEPASGHWASPHAVDPFDVPLEDKLALLFAAEAALRDGGGDERIARSVASVRAWRERKAFASTDGAACTQETVGTGAGVGTWASDGSELQVRSYPLAHGGLFAAAGWEHVLALDLVAHAPRVSAEAIELLTAPECPEGVTTIVLDGEQLALQVHESVGHALELDRILLGEASYAGTSWVQPADIGSAR